MGKAFLIFAGTGGKSGMTVVYLVIAALVLVIAGYLLLRKKKK
jgi:LPXTG-motif cell wall-anchored protein